MSKPLPMLCQNVDVYTGPYVPTIGLLGKVTADGMGPADIIHVIGVDEQKRKHQLGELRDSVLSVIFDPRRHVMVRAIRLASSGNPVNVWVG
jgi:hypothetical protein